MLKIKLATSDSSTINDDVLSTDAELYALGCAAGTYIVRAGIIFDDQSGGQLNFNYDWVFSGTATFNWAKPLDAAFNDFAGTTVPLGEAHVLVTPTGILVVTVGGNLSLRWAQSNASSVGPLVRKANSWIGRELVEVA